MKLAEALQMKTDLKMDLGRIQRRLEAVSLVEEGSKPAEDPYALLNRHLSISERLESITIKIANTNQTESISFGGETFVLSKALAKREQLRHRVKFLRDLHESMVTGRRGLYYNDNTKMVATIEPTEIETRANAAASDLRTLNSAIQEKNWTTEIPMAKAGNSNVTSSEPTEG